MSRAWSRRILAVIFTAAGSLHFIKPGMYKAIVPPSFPAPDVLVAVSGAAEIAGGLGLLVPRLRRPAGWGLIALLVAVFPANIHMAVNPDQVRGLDVPRWLLWARLPLQPLLIIWVERATRRDP